MKLLRSRRPTTTVNSRKAHTVSKDHQPLETSSARTALRAELGTLTTEAVDGTLSNLDTMDTLDLVKAMNARDQTVPHAVANEAMFIAAAVDAIAERMARGGRLIYIGAGTAGRLAVTDASECPPTFGTDPSVVIGIVAGGDQAIRSAVEGAEDDEEAGRRDLRHQHLTDVDVVVGISASGRTPYVCAAVDLANQLGAHTIGLTCNRGSRIGAQATTAIEVVVGPELVAGSTRLKAGTAQKLVLNMLSTLAMVRLGKTYGNIMVDLQVTNEKLLARAERTVMSITGVTAEEASVALGATHGSVKEAILAISNQIPPELAQALLVEHDGRLRNALAPASACLSLGP